MKVGQMKTACEHCNTKWRLLPSYALYDKIHPSLNLQNNFIKAHQMLMISIYAYERWVVMTELQLLLSKLYFPG